MEGLLEYTDFKKKSNFSDDIKSTAFPIILNGIEKYSGNGMPTIESSLEQVDGASTYGKVFLYTQVILLVLLTSFGVTFNSLVFLSFYRRPALRSFSNRFVLNLCVCHLLHCVLVQSPTAVSMLTHSWMFGETACIISAVVSTSLNIASVLSLLLIALDRNCAVNSPLHYSMTVTKKRTGALILGFWALSLLVALPPLFGIASIEYRWEWHTCTMKWLPGNPYCIAYDTVLFGVGFAVPLFTIGFVYCSMFQAARTNSERARKHSLNSSLGEVTIPDTVGKAQTTTPKKRFRRMSSGSSQSSFFGDEWKAVRTGLLVVSTFTLCWFPYYLVLYFEAFHPIKDFIPPIVMYLVLFCCFSASVINPYLYVFRNKAFRKQVKKLLNCYYPIVRKLTKRKTPADCQSQPKINNACVLAASLVNSASEKVKATPIMYHDIEGHWQVFSTSEERSREDLDESMSNVSDDCLDKDPREFYRRKSLGSANVHAIYGTNFSRGGLIKNMSSNSLSHQSHRLLLYRLRSQLHRDSTSSDTTENYSMSLDSEPPERDSLSSRQMATKILSSSTSDESKDYRSAGAPLTRIGSLTEDSGCEKCNISLIGSTRRRSFIHSHNKHRKSSETTLTSSANSDTLDSNTATRSREKSDISKEVRPKLVRQEETNESMER